MNALLIDKYRENRGGWSRILEVGCKVCSQIIFHYQKDGSGPVKRSYIDRIIGKPPSYDSRGYYFCNNCKACLGFNEPYSKENNRPAVRWAAEAVMYKVVTSESLKK